MGPYGLTAWGQAVKAHLNKLLLLQKRALRLMYFLNPRTHAIPFFLFLLKYYPFTCFTLKLSYTLCIMSQITLLQKISLKIIVKSSLIHSYNTNAASCGKYHIQFSRLNQQQNSFSCFGPKAWNCLPSQVCNLQKLAFKKSIRKALFAALESEEDYIEAPNLLSKIKLYFILLFVTNHCLSLRLSSLFSLSRLLPFTNQ